MNETKSGFSGFLKNKNTVTILGTLVAVAILFFGYYYQVNNATKPVKVVVAKEDIQSRTKITCEMLEEVEISQDMFKKLNRQMDGKGVYQSSSSICRDITAFPNSAFSNYNTMIPKGTPLVKSVNVVDGSAIPTSVLKEIPDGYMPYPFQVDESSTYGNAIMPGNYVDIYMKAVSDEGKVMFGKLLHDVEVLAALDSSYQDVFGNTEEQRTTSQFMFSVTKENYMLFKKASFLPQVELIPVPITESINNSDYNGSIEVATSYLKKYIDDRTEEIPEDELKPGNNEDNNDDDEDELPFGNN